jgi:ubiquinone/menaquinone biosynthesis C-methylase UbiE
MSGKRVLDIGCRDGQSLTQPYYSSALERCGIDADEAAIVSGRDRFPDLELSIGRAEELPYTSDRFDHVVSTVTLPYTKIPQALAEIYRVLQPGGSVYLTFHDMKMVWGWAREGRTLRHHLDHVYIFAASGVYALTGHVMARPWSAAPETFQTEGRLRRDLSRIGFRNLEFRRTERVWSVSALK